MADRRVNAGPVWNVWRGVIGVGYLVAAGFNLFFTLPRGELSWFAENAWWPWLDRFVMEVVIPNQEVVMAAVVVFEVAVAWLIMSHGRRVDLGVAVSVAWVLLLMPFLIPVPMAATNLVLAGLQGILAFRRYDMSLWDLMTSGLRTDPHPR